MVDGGSAAVSVVSVGVFFGRLAVSPCFKYRRIVEISSFAIVQVSSYGSN